MAGTNTKKKSSARTTTMKPAPAPSTSVKRSMRASTQAASSKTRRRIENTGSGAIDALARGDDAVSPAQSPKVASARRYPIHTDAGSDADDVQKADDGAEADDVEDAEDAADAVNGEDTDDDEQFEDEQQTDEVVDDVADNEDDLPCISDLVAALPPAKRVEAVGDNKGQDVTMLYTSFALWPENGVQRRLERATAVPITAGAVILALANPSDLRIYNSFLTSKSSTRPGLYQIAGTVFHHDLGQNKVMGQQIGLFPAEYFWGRTVSAIGQAIGVQRVNFSVYKEALTIKTKGSGEATGPFGGRSTGLSPRRNAPAAADFPVRSGTSVVPVHDARDWNPSEPFIPTGNYIHLTLDAVVIVTFTVGLWTRNTNGYTKEIAGLNIQDVYVLHDEPAQVMNVDVNEWYGCAPK